MVNSPTHARALPNAVKLLAGVVLLCVSSGCNKVVVYKDDRLAHGYTVPDKALLGSRNKAVLEGKFKDVDPAPANGRIQPINKPFSEEWAYNSRDPKAPPVLCLALSGGGVRSAAFGMGVLKGLNERRVLEHVDVISAVSGGSYLSSWFYAQHFHRKKEYWSGGKGAVGRSAEARDTMHSISSDLFDFNGKYQDYLKKNSRLISRGEYLTQNAISVVPMSLVNFTLNGLFGLRANTTPARDEYESRLRETYHSLNGEWPPEQVELDMTTVGEESQGRLPFLVINTTALIEDDARRHGARLANSVFELTFLQLGSDAFGRFNYATWPNNITLARAASISGAALDSAELVAGPSQKVFWSLLNVDLGYYINNPGVLADERNKPRLLPFPFYFFSKHYTRDINASDIYLTDGGHSENLGAFSLVRRLCEAIIIVDAEYDPEYEFTGYGALKNALAREMKVELSVGDIDSQIKPREGDSPKQRDYTEGKRWQYYAQRPVMKGTICCLPYPERRRDTIDVTYIKLAYHPEKRKFSEDGGEVMRCFDDRLKNFFDGRRKSTYFTPWLKRLSSPFPQDPTIDQSFDSDQYEHYRDLGYAIVMADRNKFPAEGQHSKVQCPGSIQ